MSWKHKIDALAEGKTIETSEKGNSMTPIIESGQKFLLEPITWDKCEVGDIVFCKCRGSYFTHLVTAKNDDKGCQISNNHGYVNGWTKQVYGRVVEVFSK